MIWRDKACTSQGMEIIAELERRFEALIHRKNELEEQNKQLRAELEEARRGRDDVLAKVEGLLARVQEESLRE